MFLSFVTPQSARGYRLGVIAVPVIRGSRSVRLAETLPLWPLTPPEPTDVLMCFLVDDEAQADIAETLLIKTNQVFVSRTVLLEAEWVLRSVYRIDRSAVADVLKQLLDAENLVIEDAEQVSHASEWYKMGADFLDALHLVVCGGVTMHTFYRGFCQAARKALLAPEVKVLSANESP